MQDLVEDSINPGEMLPTKSMLEGTANYLKYTLYIINLYHT